MTGCLRSGRFFFFFLGRFLKTEPEAGVLAQVMGRTLQEKGSERRTGTSLAQIVPQSWFQPEAKGPVFCSPMSVSHREGAQDASVSQGQFCGESTEAPVSSQQPILGAAEGWGCQPGKI